MLKGITQDMANTLATPGPSQDEEQAMHTIHISGAGEQGNYMPPSPSPPTASPGSRTPTAPLPPSLGGMVNEAGARDFSAGVNSEALPPVRRASTTSSLLSLGSRSNEAEEGDVQREEQIGENYNLDRLVKTTFGHLR